MFNLLCERFFRFRLSGVLGLLVMLAPVTGSAAETTDTILLTKHRVISCNIRVALTSDTLEGVGWDVRKDVCAEVIRRQNADIVCLQEVLREQINDLISTLPQYQMFGFDGPEMDYKGKDYRGIAKNPILYLKNKYELVATGTYWLSETPLIGGSLSWGSARARHLNWVRLKDRETGREFRVMNTHLDHITQQARLKQIELVLAESGQYAADFPQIFTGDFNARATNDVIKNIVAAGWTDTWVELKGTVDAGYTTHGFKGDAQVRTKPAKYPRIDFIFTRGGIKAMETHVIKDEINGRYPSDHYFLSADLKF